MLGALALVTVVVADTIIHEKPTQPRDRFETRYDVQVLRTIDDYRYLLRDSDGTIYHGIFCSNYEPQFDAGMTLDRLTFEDRGDCWDIRAPHSYIIRRDQNGYALREKFAYDQARPETSASTRTNRPTIGTIGPNETSQSPGSH